MAKKPVVLIIRDGWGVNPGGEETAKKDGNATLLAKTPFHEVMFAKYPKGFLSASGLDVGLPPGQMGNSEVGHLNLGAGRIVYQDLTRINKSIDEGTLGKNPVFVEALEKAKSSRLHLLGLVSDGGVHSHQDQLIAMVKLAKEAGVEDIFIHAITDGRDTSPTGGEGFVAKVEDEAAKSGARIATVIGRYFAMDRDKRWDRVKLAWDAIVLGKGEKREVLASEAIADYYRLDKTDEFMPPMIFTEADTQRVRDGDVVLFFNFRSDRARELSEAFLYPDFDGFDREVTPKIHFVTLTQYDEKYGCPEIFSAQTLDMVLGQTVANAGMTQMRIAETEKYPHVTYFFNGGEEVAYEGEDRVIIPSPKDVPTYDFKPEMSARQVTDTVVAKLKDYDMVILNFANPDMVGHTGVVEAAMKACETIDADVKEIAEETLRLGGKLLITADHGNCEFMRNADGSPNTAHTTNLVHLFYVAEDADQYTVADGILADVAPTLLDMLGLAQPKQMTGKSLLVRKTDQPVRKAVKSAAKQASVPTPVAKPAATLLEKKKSLVKKSKGSLKKWSR
ncbi:2,3-bisphosphoglycerate-independent phosphoglycerate mutase [Luteolibacter yonseiensis]|uniref:2,3-bisphosphoglycerate-independent phosphoglycerate mutase n=1 Tax=Luteolibacter yonseiensis TaxID=1144680 RepID=A0A934R709_9BACT|nr:2,3-bisphosphoglycerate-independent phosphoglycerate mutase [Luteolibacter yonseiensis]MBK1818144.1 2,3-bisphosphoglycerate-independent phosphoglycerate mutase [Luteolibacter yonseiensis]